VRADFVDDDQPCSTEHFDETVVYLLLRAYDECGCPCHTAAVIAAEPGYGDTAIRRYGDCPPSTDAR
jgi:hypothetical protein